MKSISFFVAFVLIVIAVTTSYAQIHYTPGWGHGKRSLGSQFEDSGTDGTPSCLEQTELTLLVEVAKVLTREAKRLSSCIKDCPNV